MSFDVIKRYEDEPSSATQVRWLKSDQMSPYDFTSGWSFRVQWIDPGGVVTKEKVTGFTGGDGGDKRKIKQSNLVISWTTDDLSGLGSAQGTEYRLRIGARQGADDWMFLGDTDAMPRMIVTSEPV